MDFTRFALDVYVSYGLRKTGLASAPSATVQLVVGYVSLDGKSLVNPGLRARFVPPDVHYSPFPPLFFSFCGKSHFGIRHRDVYEMEPPMDEAHKQGITIWSDVSISFSLLLHCSIFIFRFSLALSLRIGKSK